MPFPRLVGGATVAVLALGVALTGGCGGGGDNKTACTEIFTAEVTANQALGSALGDYAKGKTNAEGNRARMNAITHDEAATVRKAAGKAGGQVKSAANELASALEQTDWAVGGSDTPKRADEAAKKLVTACGSVKPSPSAKG